MHNEPSLASQASDEEAYLTAVRAMVQRHLASTRRSSSSRTDDGDGGDGDVHMRIVSRPAAVPPPVQSAGDAGLAAAAGAVSSIVSAVSAARFTAAAATSSAAPAPAGGLDVRAITVPSLPSAIALARAVSEESGAPPTPASQLERWGLSGLGAADAEDLQAWLHDPAPHARGISTDRFLHLLAALPSAPAPGVSQQTVARLHAVRDAFILRNGIPTFHVGVHYNTTKHALEVRGLPGWWG